MLSPFGVVIVPQKKTSNTVSVYFLYVAVYIDERGEINIPF